MPAEQPAYSTFKANDAMDFSRNGHFFNPSIASDTGNSNAPGDMDDLNNRPATEQDILRRLAGGPRTTGLPVGPNANAFGAGAGQPSGMVSVGMNPNQFASGVAPVVGAGAGFPMVAQQGDRDEDLILQILLARRQRQQFQEFQASTNSAEGDATAAMFGSDQEQQLQQMHQMQQHQHQQGTGGLSGMFSGPGFNLPSSANFMQGIGGPGSLTNLNATNTFPGGYHLDNYLLRTQQTPQQESILAHSDNQRIELSPSRYFSLQQQQAGLMSDMMIGANKRGLEDDMKFGAGLGKVDGDGSEKAPKKKRLHKKKPSDMPRRPLSAYNLFFSEERERILNEIEKKEKGDSGEYPDKCDDETIDPQEDEPKKPRALLRPLLPSEKKRRPHRKTHGKISFRELAQMVGQRWKALSQERRQYYQGLAKEDMARQKKAMEEYYLKQSEKVMNEPEEGVAEEGSAEGITQS